MFKGHLIARKLPKLTSSNVRNLNVCFVGSETMHVMPKMAASAYKRERLTRLLTSVVQMCLIGSNLDNQPRTVENSCNKGNNEKPVDRVRTTLLGGKYIR